MSLRTIAGRAKWCVRHLAVLACCAPTLAYADIYPYRSGFDFEGATLALNTHPSRLSRRSPHAEASSLRRFDGSAQKPLGATHFLVVNGGFLGIFNRFPETLRYGAEFRWRELSQLKLRPSVGIVNAENDASYYYLGLRRDFMLSRHLVLTGSFDAGYFEERDELELGLQMEFRSGAEMSYRFDNNYRIGVALYHLSNGGFGDRNPGTEAIVLSLIAPVQ